MTIHKKIMILLLWVQAFYSPLTFAEEKQLPDMERVTINLHVATVSIAIPIAVDADYSDEPHYAKQVNIFDEKLFYTAGQTHVAYSHLWAFKGHFWQGYIGELLLQVSVFKIRQGATMEQLFSPSPQKELIDIGGMQWRKTGDISGQVNYAAPLTADHFVSISFNFIDDSDRKNLTWQVRAQRLMEQIVPTLKLERHSATEISPVPPEHEQQPISPHAPVFPAR